MQTLKKVERERERDHPNGPADPDIRRKSKVDGYLSISEILYLVHTGYHRTSDKLRRRSKEIDK